MNDRIDYRAVRRRVEEGVKRQKQLAGLILFGISLLMFVLFVILAFGLYASGNSAAGALVVDAGRVTTDNPVLSAMIMLGTGWFVTLIFQAITLFMNTKAGEEQIRDKVIGRELGRELLRLGVGDEEPLEKRKRMLRMADDGEVEEVLDEASLEMEEELIRRSGSSQSR